MIKFFRHIRKSLIEKNQMGKYFKYAIGEILLVVIGILIALQINNWNENNKQRKHQNFLFEQLLADAKKEFSFFEDRLQGLMTLDSTLNTIRNFGEDSTYNIASINTNGTGYPFLMTSFRHASILLDNSEEVYNDLIDSELKSTLRDYRGKYAYILSSYKRLNDRLTSIWKSTSVNYYKELRENKNSGSIEALRIIYQDEKLQANVDLIKNAIGTATLRTEEFLQINEKLIIMLIDKLGHD